MFFDASLHVLTSSLSSVQNLAKCCSSVNQLNRNIENVTEVGKGFDAVHDLWKQFETVMANGVAPSNVGLHEWSDQVTLADCVHLVIQETAREPILERQLPEGTDQTAVLPAGLAPGAGDRVLLPATRTNEND